MRKKWTGWSQEWSTLRTDPLSRLGIVPDSCHHHWVGRGVLGQAPAAQPWGRPLHSPEEQNDTVKTRLGCIWRLTTLSLFFGGANIFIPLNGLCDQSVLKRPDFSVQQAQPIALKPRIKPGWRLRTTEFLGASFQPCRGCRPTGVSG